jgi:ABC-type uncharacterized transport system substrate-binding protein
VVFVVVSDPVGAGLAASLSRPGGISLACSTSKPLATIDLFRRAAPYVDRLLKGEKPADMPIQAPVKFEMAINLRNAKALGLTIPPSLQATADEVIE